METTKTASAIKDLIIINNDRYEGYKTAADEIKDADLKSLFTDFSNQSKGFSLELRKFVPSSEEQPKRDETKNSGKLFRIWMDVKAAISGNDRKAVLSSCEFGEDRAKATYDDVLDHTEDIPTEAMQVITQQRAAIQKGHDVVKSLRDSIA
ncbi:MAG: PA2169 family four-helix-bundle protein [Bacteroidetes bacterium]|nr:PA2169 family four-helix-bundle protein [Bacteroidota bacterium]